MSTEASLKIGVDSTEVTQAEKALSDLAKTGAGAEKATKNLGDEAKKAAESSKGMSTGFSGAANSIKNLVGAYVSFQAVKAALTSVITTTAEFSQSIANLSAITGATGKDLEYYSNQAKEIGRTTSLSASQAAEGFKLIASAKPDLLASAESLAQVTKQAVILAEATGSTLPEAASALGSALNQFQLPASDASRVINALAASSQLGTAEVTAVTEAMRNAGSAANSLGLDFEETVAGIQALAASGRQGADAGTALRQVLLKLEATGNENLQPSLVGLVGALDELKSMNLDNTELMDLFGQEAFTAATSLLAQSDVAKELNVSLRGTNTAVEQAATNMNTLSGDYLKAKSAAEALQITIGENLEPQLRSFTQSITTAMEALNKFYSRNKSDDELIESLGMIVDENGNLVDSAEAAAAAAAKFQEGMREAAQEAEVLAESVVVAQEAVESWNEKTLLQIDALENEKLALQMTDRAQAIFNATLKALANGAAPDAIAKIATLAAENYDLAESQDDAEESLKQWNESIKEYLKEQAKATEEQTKAEESVKSTITALENETASLGMTARAQAIFNAVTNEYNKGTAPEQIARIAELTAINYDLAESNNVTGKAAEDAAKQAADSWQKTHDYLSEAFVDIMNNGGNAFDNIAKAFERTVQRMVAEWAASGLMKLFTGGGLSGFSMPSFGGSGSGGGGGGFNLPSFGGGGGGTAPVVTSNPVGFVGPPAPTSAGTASVPPTTGSAALTAIKTAGASFVGSYAGNKAGQEVFDKQANSNIGATIGSTVGGFIGGPIGAGIGGFVGGMADVAFGTDGTFAGNSGFLIRGRNGDGEFDVPSFDSGFDPVGFTRRGDIGSATAIIDTFRQYDSYLTEVAKSSGLNVNYNSNNFGGFNEKGRGNGTYFGTANEGDQSTAVPLEQQLTQFVKQWITGLTGQVDQSLINDVISAGNADAMIQRVAELTASQGSYANGIDYVPFTGQATLHRGEKVTSVAERARDSVSNDRMAAEMGQLRQEMQEQKVYNRRTFEILDRWAASNFAVVV